jgi:pyrroline-5-carboxylate reductase
MKVSFIGFGNIAKAIAHGLMKQKHFSLYAAAPSLTPNQFDGVCTTSDNKAVVGNTEVLVLAVKPMVMDEVLKEISPLLPAHCLVISVATGLNFQWFAKRLPQHQPVVRAMPNTPAQVACAATPLIANSWVNNKQKNEAEAIFAHIGLTAWAQHEEEIDAFTALSGSGPAYFFLFLEEMIKAAVTLGLSESVAKTFALQTAEGAIQLAKQSPLDLTALRNSVTSPAGTTAAALNQLNPQLGTLVLQAMKAAKERAIEIGQSF